MIKIPATAKLFGLMVAAGVATGLLFYYGKKNNWPLIETAADGYDY